MHGERIRVSGIVQGVGFRPTVWRLARDNDLRGQVWNDSEGVLIDAWAPDDAIERFVQQLLKHPPPLARIEGVERTLLEPGAAAPGQFEIVQSASGTVRTSVPPDTATCPECLAETLDADDRRYRYPFTNCTHCGPRLSIIRSIPYDRANTSMSSFPMCPECQAEYEDPSDRRFHAQPNACGECGPAVWLEDAGGNRLGADEGCDVIETAARLIRQGSIVAIKGIGGFHLVCDACDEDAVGELRRRKRRHLIRFRSWRGIWR